MVKKMLDSNFIRCSNSPCVNLVVLVKDKFSIPLVEELLEELGGAIVFIKFDLRLGYWQVRMCPNDVYKTSFKTY